VSPPIGHGGKNRMSSELKMKFFNITNETITVCLSLCVHCQKKSSNPKKELISKPIEICLPLGYHKIIQMTGQMA